MHVMVMEQKVELPIEVVQVQHILSFLPIEQVVQSSIFSKRWKRVWTTFPIPGFDEIKIRNLKRKRDSLCSFVDQNLRINNFTLDEKSVSRVDRWIGFVVESDVKELILHFEGSRFY
jgi:hypothetical protein